MSKSKLARDVVDGIVKDIRARNAPPWSLGNEWAEMSDDVRRDIKTEWMRIVLSVLSENSDLDYQSDAPWIVEGGEPSVPAPFKKTPVTLAEFREHVGPGGRIRLSWNREDGWTLIVTTGDAKALVEKSDGEDLEVLLDRCAVALKAVRRV